jgi:hypothetical protein
VDKDLAVRLPENVRVSKLDERARDRRGRSCVPFRARLAESTKQKMKVWAVDRLLFTQALEAKSGTKDAFHVTRLCRRSRLHFGKATPMIGTLRSPRFTIA